MFEFFPGNYRWSYNSWLAFAAGAELGDFALILPTLSIAAGKDDIWHREWKRLGDLVIGRLGKESSNRTRSETLFLGSLYHIMSEQFVPLQDPQRMSSYLGALRHFREANACSPTPLEPVSIPYEGKSLAGYFQAAANREKAPTIILIPGLDSTKEIWYLRARDAFAARGLNCLFVDTPGNGEAIRLQGLPAVYDFERPVKAIIDWLKERPNVDTDRIGMVGSSLGGYYVARAAAFEPRLKAVAAWGAIYDYHAIWHKRLTVGATMAAPAFQLMFITGKSTSEQALAHIENFKVVQFASQIRCPFLVAHGRADQQIPEVDAKAMFDAVGSLDKEFKIFDGENGGAAHCQFDNHRPALNYVADWIAARLGLV